MSSSTSTFQSELLKRLDQISQQLSALSSSSTSKSSKTSEKKARKPRKADAKENPWITFTTQVRGWLKEAIEAGDAEKDAAGIKCQQFCKFLKETHGDQTYSLEKEEVLAAHSTWTPPESEKKPKPAAAAPAKKSSKLASKKAIAKALDDLDLDDEGGGTTVEHLQSLYKAAKKPAAAAAPAPKPAPAPSAPAKSKDRIIRLSGVPHVWNTENNQIFRAEEDSSRGEYLGIFDPATKKIDDSVPE
jgi:pyruvate/2-oxoglutarate dehydrogenase complex dihydrolipoamide acyltransferase (E2) component